MKTQIDGPMTLRDFITCPKCGRATYHPEDIRQGYCGHCHIFHGYDLARLESESVSHPSELPIEKNIRVIHVRLKRRSLAGRLRRLPGNWRWYWQISGHLPRCERIRFCWSMAALLIFPPAPRR